MGKLRLIFTKEGRAVYISHLDLLRTFQRVFLRQGLVLRQASDCEILDFETDGETDGSGLPEALNRFMPEGVRASDCYIPVRPIRELAALRCRVELFYDGGVPEGAAEAVRSLLTGESVVIQKRTKRKAMADIDIRPMLHSLEVTEEPGSLCLDAVVSAQNPGLNPALLVTAAEVHLPRLAPDFAQVRRLELLDAEGGVFR